jgi:hypothetical protein
MEVRKTTKATSNPPKFGPLPVDAAAANPELFCVISMDHAARPTLPALTLAAVNN